MAETKTISIHAAQEGCDVQGQIFHQSNLISIHAAQEGCDKGLTVQDGAEVNFNPRSPRGLRLGNLKILWGLLNISIHAAQEGCDQQQRNGQYTEKISIHAAQEGCDRQRQCCFVGH